MDFFNFSKGELTAIWLSLKVGLWCAFVTLPFAVVLGYFFARKTFRFKLLLEVLLHLPLVLPPITTGYLLLIFLGKKGVLGKYLDQLFGIHLAYNFNAAVIAAIVVSFPLVFRAVRIAIEMVDQNYELAARSLGASKLKTFFMVTLPLALPGLVSGFVLSFARSMGEFGATISFAGNIEGITRTLPLALFSSLQVPGQEMVSARLAVVSIALAFMAMVVSEWINRKRIR